MKALRRTQAPQLLLVVTTVGTEEQALDIAHRLVGSHLAACVNIVPHVRSVFFWKKKVNDDSEFLLIFKTLRESFPAVRDTIKRLHAYELPEILGFPADFADGAFARWVEKGSRGKRKARPAAPKGRRRPR